MGIAILTGTPIAVRPLNREPASHTLGAEIEIAFEGPFGTIYAGQEESEWCWAACFQMIRSALKMEPRSQHEIATRVFGADACKDRKSGACNRSASPEAVAHRVGLTCSEQWVLSADELSAYLVTSPVELMFQGSTPKGPRSHVVLVAGMRGNVVEVLDPWPAFGRSEPDYEDLAHHHYWGDWTKSFVLFAKS